MAYVIGKGALLKLSISSVFTTVPQCKSITPPQIEMGTVETTHLTSSMREHMATINDPGECSFEIEYDPANTVHQALWASAQAGTVESWKITLSDAGAADITFSAHIQKFGISQMAVDSVVMIPVTLKVSGAVTITP